MIKYCYLLGKNDSLSSEVELANLGLDLQGMRKPTPRFSFYSHRRGRARAFFLSATSTAISSFLLADTCA